MVPGHRDWFGLPVADGFRHAQGDGAWGGPASGYVASSVRDMASYLRMYLNGGMGGDGGLIAMGPDGTPAFAINDLGMYRGRIGPGMTPWTAIFADEKP